MHFRISYNRCIKKPPRAFAGGGGRRLKSAGVRSDDVDDYGVGFVSGTNDLENLLEILNGDTEQSVVWNFLIC